MLRRECRVWYRTVSGPEQMSSASPLEADVPGEPCARFDTVVLAVPFGQHSPGPQDAS
jgi:hypothetical protein